MGIFSKWGSKEKEYAELDSSHPSAAFLSNLQQNLEPFIKSVSDPLEIIPSQEAAYVFVGKPPKVFGFVWIHKDGVFNMKKVVAEKGIPITDYQLLSDELRDAYIRSQDAERYSAQLGGKKIVVTPSESLVKEVENIVKKLEK